MSNIVRIIVVVLCAAALFYLVVTLARSVSEEETGSLESVRPGIEARVASLPGG